MVERRDFGPVAGQMRQALEKYSREELADLLTHIVRVYVIEGKEPQLTDTGKVGTTDSLRSLSFSQLILHLQMNLPHPELQAFRVSGDRVWAERRGNEVLIAGDPPDDEVPPDWDDLAPREPPRSRPVVRAQPQRAATGPVSREPLDEGPSIGVPRRRIRRQETPGVIASEASQVERPNVGLREEQPAPAPRAERPAVPNDWFQDPPQPSRPGRVAGKDAKSPKEAEEEVTERSDRFSMLELD